MAGEAIIINVARASLWLQSQPGSRRSARPRSKPNGAAVATQAAPDPISETVGLKEGPAGQDVIAPPNTRELGTIPPNSGPIV